MIPHSPLMAEAVRYGHSVRSQVDVFRGAVSLGSDVKLKSGSVKSDRGSNTRWTAQVVLGLADWDATSVSTDGCTFTVRRGVTTLGYSEMLPLGVYRVTDVNRDTTGEVKLTGEGLEGFVIDDRFLVPRQPPYGQSTIQAIADLIGESTPGPVVGVIASNTYDKPVQATAAWDRDRVKAINQLAQSIKAEVFADSTGTWVIKDDPTLQLAAYVFVVDAGDGGVLIEASGGETRDGVYNGVVVTGRDATEDGQPPVVAVVVDDNPASRTYWHGPFGHKPRFYSNDGIDSQERAVEIGKAMLQGALTANSSFKFTSAAVCFLEASDVVRVVGKDRSWKDYLLNSTSLDLGVDGTLSCETYVMREQLVNET